MPTLRMFNCDCCDVSSSSGGKINVPCCDVPVPGTINATYASAMCPGLNGATVLTYQFINFLGVSGWRSPTIWTCNGIDYFLTLVCEGDQWMSTLYAHFSDGVLQLNFDEFVCDPFYIRVAHDNFIEVGTECCGGTGGDCVVEYSL